MTSQRAFPALRSQMGTSRGRAQSRLYRRRRGRNADRDPPQISQYRCLGPEHESRYGWLERSRRGPGPPSCKLCRIYSTHSFASNGIGRTQKRFQFPSHARAVLHATEATSPCLMCFATAWLSSSVSPMAGRISMLPPSRLTFIPLSIGAAETFGTILISVRGYEIRFTSLPPR